MVVLVQLKSVSRWPAASFECPAWQSPRFRFRDEHLICWVYQGHSESDQRRITASRIGSSSICQLFNRHSLFDRAAELSLVSHNAGKAVGSNLANGCPLIGTTEDAGHAGNTRKSQAVGRMRIDAPPLDDLPNLLFAPVDH